SLIPLPNSFGSVPLAVVWFGALGAVLISLTGIVEHAHDWDPSFALWHLSRPLVGASLAIVAVLILQAGVLAIGTTPTGTTPPADVPKNLLYYLVAFLVGYREETFRELIKRLVDLILAPAGAGAAPKITALAPNTAPAAGKVPVVLSGSGFTGTTAVTFGSSSATFTVNSDGQITAEAPQGAPGKVTVTVKAKTGSATASFEYT
ncbi:MAG TPA: IPT/TIG domain-containing protein, partial [Blastocatellia bacterium]